MPWKRIQRVAEKMCLNTEVVQALKKTLAKLVTLKGSGSLSPRVYFLNDECLGNVLKMRQSISRFSVNILCWCLGKVVKMAMNKKVNLITLLNFPSLVKPKGK